MDKIKLYTEQDYNYHTESPYAKMILHGVYFHGQTEEILGHDIICVPMGTAIPDGKHQFIVNSQPHGHEICSGTLYLWTTKYGNQKGLAVLDDDVESVKYAEHHFKNQSSSL